MDRSVHYFKYAKKILSLVGLWRTQTRSQRLLRCHIIGLMSLYCVFGQLCQIYTSYVDLESLLRLLPIFIPTLCGTIMFYTSIFNFRKIEELYSYILQDPEIIEDDNEMDIMDTYTYYGNLFIFSSCILTYVCTFINFAWSLLRIILSTNVIRSDVDVYPIISCLDYFSNRETYYYPIIMYQSVINIIMVTASIISYANYFTFVFHACAHLCIIKYKIYSPFVHYNHKDNVPVPLLDLSPWITGIIKRQVRTKEYDGSLTMFLCFFYRRFINLLNTVYERSNLIQMCLAFILLILDFLCISALLEHKTVSKDVSQFVMYIVTSLFVIYVYCFIGQMLMNKSSDAYNEACLVPFQEMSLKTQKLLLTMLIMSTKPCAVSIGKVYTASHEFFGNLLRTSLSFAMVIRSIQYI